jgi:enoyl-CoA hydratase
LSSPVLTEARADVLVVTLDRPRVRNAIDLETIDGLETALDRLDGDPALRAGVLTGASGTFCAGMDLKAFAAVQDDSVAENALARIVRRTTRRPLIAAVEGFAVGGGCELALACDLIVAASDASFGLPEVRHSLVPSGGGLLRLPRRLPFGLAMEMALTGAMMGADRAFEHGLVNRLVAPGAALDAALALAAEVAANGPLALTAIKALVWGQLDQTSEQYWAAQDRVLPAVNSSHDAREGVRAFTEKRAPVWEGR